MHTHTMSTSFLPLMSFLFIFSTLIDALPNPNPNPNPDPNPELFFNCLSLHHSTSNSSSFVPITKLIYTPRNPSFTSVLDSYIQNTRFLTSIYPKPIAIVTALEISHIQATISCAKVLLLEVRIRSGGHDFEGLSYISNSTFVILDLNEMRNISIDAAAGTAWVQVGATLGELYYRVSQASKTYGFPAGYCPTVGAGGHIAGGGYGVMLRKYGLASDQVIDAIFVDAEGKVMNKKSMGEDLFWALRGGSGGSFGLVVAWKVKLVRVPEKVTVFTFPKTLEQNSTLILHRWQSIGHTLDENLMIAANITTTLNKAGKKTVLVTFDGIFLGSLDRFVSTLQKGFPELTFSREECKEVSWIESMVHFGGFDGQPLTILLNRTGRLRLKGLSDYVTTPIPIEGLEVLWEVLYKIDVGIPSFNWHPYGGRMAKISPTETAYPHRGGIHYMMFISAIWNGGGVEETRKNVEWVNEVHNYLTPYVSKNPRRAYVNYRDLGLGENKIGDARGNYERAKATWGSQYYVENFERLVKVKNTVDPENFFTFEQSIPVLPRK